jgi:hypothetical protein
MRGHGAKFSRKMEEAIAALLTQKNFEEAARVVGVGTATLLRWQKLPESTDGSPPTAIDRGLSRFAGQEAAT